MLVKLKEMGDVLQEYVESATPTGWVCSWDSATCRYYYKNQTTGDVSWGYPSQSVGSPMSSQEETDPCSMEEETREGNGDEPAAAVQETESSVDSGVDEKLDKQLLMAQAPPPPPLPVTSDEPATPSADPSQDQSMPTPMDEAPSAQQPQQQQRSAANYQNIFPSEEAKPTDSSAYMSPPDSTEATPDKGRREGEGQEAVVDQPKEDLYAFLPPAANSAEKEAELPQAQPQSFEPPSELPQQIQPQSFEPPAELPQQIQPQSFEPPAELSPEIQPQSFEPPAELPQQIQPPSFELPAQVAAKGLLYPPTVPPVEIEGASCETSAISREDIGMSIDDEEARLRQKLLRRLKPSSAGEVDVETDGGLVTAKAEPVSEPTDREAGEADDGENESNLTCQAVPDLSQPLTTDSETQAKPDVKLEDSERAEESAVTQEDAAKAGIEEPEKKPGPVDEVAQRKETESKEPTKSKKRSRDYSDHSDSDTSRHRKSYSKKSRCRYDSDHSEYSADDSRRHRSSRRRRSRSRSYDYYSDEDRHRSSRRYRSASSDDDNYYRRDSRRSSRRYSSRYSDEYSDDDDRRSSHRSSRKRRSRSRSGDRKDSKSRKDKKKKKEKKKHRHDDEDRPRSSDKRHSKSSSSSSSSRFKDKKAKDSPKPLPPPPEKTFVPAKFKPKGKVREEPEESPPDYQPVATASQEVLTPQQMEMMKNIASATGMTYGYPVMEMAPDTTAGTVPYMPPTQSALVEAVPEQQAPEIMESAPELLVAVEAVKPLDPAPYAAAEKPPTAPIGASEPAVVEMQEPEEVDMEIEEEASPVKDQEVKENQSPPAIDESKALEAYKASVIKSLSGVQQTVGSGEGALNQGEMQKKEEEKPQEVVKKPQEAVDKMQEVRPEDETLKEEQESGKGSQEDEPLPPGTLGLQSKSTSSGPPGEETTDSGPQEDEDYKMPSDDEATPPASASTTTTIATAVTTSSGTELKDSPVTCSVTSATSSATSTVSSSPTTFTTSSTATPSVAASSVIETATLAVTKDSTPPLTSVAISPAATPAVMPTSAGGYSYSAPATTYGSSYNYQNDAAQQQAYAAVYAQSMYNPAVGGTYYPYQYTSGTYDHNQYAAAMNYYANAYQAAYNASAYQAYYQQQSGGTNSNNNQKK